MGVTSEQFDSLLDDGGAIDMDSDLGEPAVGSRIVSAARAHARWRSVEEYQEWKRLKAQLGDDLDEDETVLY